MEISGIYKITNIINRSVYVGSSKNLFERLQRYKQPKCSVTKNIKESIFKYGIDNHIFKILAEFDSNIPKKELETYEDAFILLYVDRLGEEKIFNSHCNDKKKWMSNDYVYNQIKKSKGKKASYEQRLKMGNSQKGNKLGEKHPLYGKLGKDNPTSKKVNQYSLNGNFITTWDSMSDIYRFYNKDMSHISECCSGKIKTAYLYIWRYNSDYPDCKDLIL